MNSFKLLCRRAVKEQRVNLTQERQQHVLHAALWAWKSSSLSDAHCRGRLFLPDDVCCSHNISKQAASSAAAASRQDSANLRCAMHTVARKTEPRAGRERGAVDKSHNSWSSSLACAAAVDSIPTDDASGTLRLLVLPCFDSKCKHSLSDHDDVRQHVSVRARGDARGKEA